MPRARTRPACRAAWAVLAIGALASCASPALAYTVKGTLEGQPLRWEREVFELHVAPELERALPHGHARAAARIAAEAWRGYPGLPEVVIAEQPAPSFDAGDLEHGIYLVPGEQVEGGAVAVTRTRHMDSGRIVGIDILLNADYAFALFDEARADAQRGSGAYDLASVLTHELGHALGLGHTDRDQAACMWPWLEAGQIKRVLTDDDEAGVMALYAGDVDPDAMVVGADAALAPRPSSSRPASGGCSAVAQHARKPPSFATSMLAMGVLLAWRTRLRAVARRRSATHTGAGREVVSTTPVVDSALPSCSSPVDSPKNAARSATPARPAPRSRAGTRFAK